MDDPRTHHHTRNRLTVFAALLLAAFGVTLALVIADRLSDEALAVLAGTVCGVGAAIPTSLIVVAVVRQRDRPRPQQPPQPYQTPYPPVVVVAPPAAHQQSSGAWNGLPPSFNAPTRRQFTVVGGAPPDAERPIYGPGA